MLEFAALAVLDDATRDEARHGLLWIVLPQSRQRAHLVVPRVAAAGGVVGWAGVGRRAAFAEGGDGREDASGRAGVTLTPLGRPKGAPAATRVWSSRRVRERPGELKRTLSGVIGGGGSNNRPPQQWSRDRRAWKQAR